MDFVAIDLETANSDRSSICALGMVKVKDNEIVETYYTLINPETYFDGFNVMIHGIEEKDVVDSPTFENIYNDITSFTNGYNLVAHSTRFDMYAIADCMIKYNLPIWTNNYFCSQRISQELRKGLASYRLNDLVFQFGLTSFDHHHALEDAKASANIITYFVQNNELKSFELFCDTHNFKIGRLNKNGFVKLPSSKTIKITLDHSNINPQEDSIFFDKTICFTGKLQKYTRKEVAQVVTNIGANWVDRVTENVDYLVVGNLENLEKTTGYKESSKIKKAKTNANKGSSIQILSELEFYKEMESGE